MVRIPPKMGPGGYIYGRSCDGMGCNSNNVKRFITGQISHLPKYIRRDNELALTVQSKIVEAVDGM